MMPSTPRSRSSLIVVSWLIVHTCTGRPALLRASLGDDGNLPSTYRYLDAVGAKPTHDGARGGQSG